MCFPAGLCWAEGESEWSKYLKIWPIRDKYKIAGYGQDHDWGYYDKRLAYCELENDDRRVTVMYYVADADWDNDTNCRSRSRSQHTATLGWHVMMRHGAVRQHWCRDRIWAHSALLRWHCGETSTSRLMLNNILEIVMYLNSQKSTSTKSKPLPLPDQTNQAI